MFSVRALLTGVVIAFASMNASAAPNWVRDGEVQGRLVSAVQGVGNGQTVPLGVQLRLEPGWKTYWRTPGDSGLAPQFEWSGSPNLKKADVSYPTPHRFSFAGLDTFGYKGEVVMPITAHLSRQGAPLDARLKLDLLVCSEICIPRSLSLELAVPAGLATASQEAALLVAANANLPDDGTASGLKIETVVVVASAPDAAIEIVATGATAFTAPDVFIEINDGVDAFSFGTPVVKLSDGNRRARLRVPVTVTGDAALQGRSLTITLADDPRAMVTSKVVEQGNFSRDWAEFATILVFALVGGFVLNLMPCVLPVLSLKLLSAIRYGGAGHAKVRMGFLASAAGILFSFLLLAGFMIGLKYSGAAIGWGIQFQQPLFLVFMIVLVTLFAANLWGLFEVPLPRFLADTVGGSSDNGSVSGSFANGAFATLLATPCSAPFLGTAVGFALSRGTLEILAVFVALGLGLALPYLVVAAVPQIASLLPRPGMWMIRLRQVLGGALALTAIWLLTVLAVQTQAGAAYIVGGLMAAVIAIFWVRHRFNWNAAPMMAVAVLILMGVFGVPSQFSKASHVEGPSGQHHWQPFSQARIHEAVAAGKVVFVDVTAEWCITCQVNKQVVTYRGDVAKRLFSDPDTIPMQADWTRPDPAIAEYLASFRRYGIPFNVVYGPVAPEGIPLPEILTADAVMAALEKAARK